MPENEIGLMKHFRLLFGNRGIGSAKLIGPSMNDIEVEVAAILFAFQGSLPLVKLTCLTNASIEETESTLNKLSHTHLVVDGPGKNMTVPIVSSFSLSESAIHVGFNAAYLDAIKPILSLHENV